MGCMYLWSLRIAFDFSLFARFLRISSCGYFYSTQSTLIRYKNWLSLKSHCYLSWWTDLFVWIINEQVFIISHSTPNPKLSIFADMVGHKLTMCHIFTVRFCRNPRQGTGSVLWVMMFLYLEVWIEPQWF